MRYQTLPLGAPLIGRNSRQAKKNPVGTSILVVLGVAALAGGAAKLLSKSSPPAPSEAPKKPGAAPSLTPAAQKVWYREGAYVEVESGGEWYPAEVLPSPHPSKYRVHYIGWPSSWDEDVDASRIRKKG